MLAVKWGIFVIIFHLGMGLVAMTDVFPDTYYDPNLTSVDIPTNLSGDSETEQNQVSIDIFNRLWDGLTWGWMKYYFMPWYYQDTALRFLVDFFITAMRAISVILIGIAFMELVRDRAKILQ